MELVWDIPVPFSAHNPVAVEVESQEIEHPTGSGRAWIYIEPDGDVTPTQGDEQVLGNLLGRVGNAGGQGKEEWRPRADR